MGWWHSVLVWIDQSLTYHSLALPKRWVFRLWEMLTQGAVPDEV